MNVDGAIAALSAGKIIAYPTETVWGLGVDIGFPQAIKDLFELKGRDKSKAISLLVSNVFQARDVAEFSAEVENLMDLFWPGPLTFVLKARAVPTELTGGTGFIGLRFSSHPFVRALQKKYEGIITTTSANFSGQPAALSQEDLTWLPPEVLRVEWPAKLSPSPGSTVIKIVDKKISLLRAGDLDFNLVANEAKRFGFHSN